MKLQIYQNKDKVKEEDPDYIGLQRQRLNDGTTAYETVQVAVGWTNETPGGEKYIALTIEGFSDNKPKP